MRLPILMYHSISDRPGHPYARLAVSPKRFEEQLRFLAHTGCTTLTVDRMVRLRAACDLPERPVVLTFDDGYADFHHTALPLLERHGATATLYAVSGLTDAASETPPPASPWQMPIMNWSQLAEVAAAGIEVGGHGVSHAALDGLSIDAARAEIAGCKARLEERLGVEIASFAYPYGFYSTAVRRLVVEAGYRCACAVRYDLSPATDDAFALRRQIVRPDTDLAAFEAILRGRAPHRFVDRVRSRGWALVRHALQGAS